MLQLVRPALAYVESYRTALEKGWSPDNVTGERTRLKELGKIAVDPAAFVEGLQDLEAKGDPIILPDGSEVKRLPGFRRWMWDGDFVGNFNFRWVKGSTELPPHVLGHLGYSTVPWKRGQGYTKKGLALFLEEIRTLGLSHVDVTTDPDNIASQKVLLANQGVLMERFVKGQAYGGDPSLRYRIFLNSVTT